MFYCAEQIGAKSAAFRVRRANAALRQQSGEEFLGQFARGVLVASLSAQKSEHRLVVGLAQFAERGARFRRFAPGALDERPARRGETFC